MGQQWDSEGHVVNLIHEKLTLYSTLTSPEQLRHFSTPQLSLPLKYVHLNVGMPNEIKFANIQRISKFRIAFYINRYYKVCTHKIQNRLAV
jgi:hypothetical protein